VEASFSLGRDVIGWRQSKTTGETLWEKVVLKQFAQGNNGILAGDYTALDTTETENDLELKKEVEERKLHRMAKVHNFLEMRQGSQNLHATQKQSRAQNKQMTAIGYISDTEEMVKASWSHLQHDCAAAIKPSERSPLPPALSAKDLPGGRTELLNVRQIGRIDCYPVESDKDSAPESISYSENWLSWNGDFDNPNVSEDDWEADNESDIELDNEIKALESPEHRVVSATPNVPGLIQPTRMSLKQAQKALMTVTAMETRRNKGNKKSKSEWINMFTPGSICCLTENLS